MGVVTASCRLAIILFGQKASLDIKTIAAGKTVSATISIIETVIANIGPIVLKEPSIEKISKNIATTVVIEEPTIDGPTHLIADTIALNLLSDLAISSRYLDTINNT